MNEVKLFSYPHDLFLAVANDFVFRANAAVASKGEFTVVLSGGNTPSILFDILAQQAKIPWDKIKFFFGDERYVPIDNIQSNYHRANTHLFLKVGVLKENIYRIPTEYQDPKEAAQDYELTLRKVFRIQDKEFPRFDLLYLGLGEDAHTASLMPFSDVLTRGNEKLVASLWVSGQNMYRITLTPAAINHALRVVFMVTGKEKALAVAQVLEGSLNPQHYPAQLIQSAIWYLDQGAASKLNRSHHDKSNFS